MQRLASERSFCSHCFIVVCGKPSVVAIFMLPMSEPAVFSMAKSSYAYKTILVVKMLTHTWGFESIVAVVCGLVPSVVVVRRCGRCHNLFVKKYGVHFSSKKGQNRHLFLFWASLLHSTISGNNCFCVHEQCLKHKETRRPKRKGLRASGHPVIHSPHISASAFPTLKVLSINASRDRTHHPPVV